MPTIKVTTSDFSLQSKWKCYRAPSVTNTQGSLLFSMTPTWDSRNVNFKWSIPAGAKIKSSKIHTTVFPINSGASVLSANGVALRNIGRDAYEASISVSPTASTINVNFSFKANGSHTDVLEHTAIATFKNCYLQIDYDVDSNYASGGRSGSSGSSSGASGSSSGSSSGSASGLNGGMRRYEGLAIPPQSCCIYDPSNGAIYMFDGVIRIQHQLSMKIEEEPGENANEFMNNAKNEPDKLTLDIMMSDVYAGGGAIESSVAMSAAQNSALNVSRGKLSISGDSRSANAFAVLKALKETRKKLDVITPQVVHTDMIISSVVCNQDDGTPFGWQGQIIFQHAFEDKPKSSGVDNGGAKSGGDLKSGEAFVVGIAGDANENNLKSIGKSVLTVSSGNFAKSMTVVSSGRRGETAK